MYIVSVLKHLCKRSNIGTIIFFLLNAWMVIGLFSMAGPGGIVLAVVLYIGTVLLTLSPVGEWFLGAISGARKIKRSDIKERLYPIVERVYAKARTHSPDLPTDIKIKCSHEPVQNAFAVGRKTICVTQGLLLMSDDMIEGILAHEFAHLALHHTDIQVMMGGGNFLITVLLALLQALSAIVTAIGAALSRGRDLATAGCGCVLSWAGVLATLAMVLWNRFCMLFLMWSSRANEYAADAYAFQIGYGYELAQALDTLGGDLPGNSYLKALYSSHPETNDRIGKLQEMGVPYMRY